MNKRKKRTPTPVEIRQADPAQTSLCLDPAVLSTGFESDGQGNITSPGQGLQAFSLPFLIGDQAQPLERSTKSNFEQQLDQLLQDCEQAADERHANSRCVRSLSASP